MATRPSARTIRALHVAVVFLMLVSSVAACSITSVDDAKPGGAVTPQERPLDADQAEVLGIVTRAVGTQISGPVLPLPVTLSVTRGGGTKATFTGGAVNGESVSVLWDGGRPLPLTGSGSLDLAGPADVEVTAAGATWALDGSARTLTPGTYGLGAAVAVGTSGLGTPRDGASLVVATSGALTTKGGVTVSTPIANMTLEGPGILLLEGTLRVRTARGTTAARSVRFGPGPFALALAANGGGSSGYAITSGLLQGPATVEG